MTILYIHCTEKVNTMDLVILIVIVVVLYFVFLNENRSSSKSTRDNRSTPSPYNSAHIINSDIVGTFYRKDVNDKDIGDFVGYIINEDNINDRFTVAVYNSQNKKLGYVPKNDGRLYCTLKEWHGGRLLCWGGLWKSGDEGYWGGVMYAPICVEKEKINSMELALHLIIKNKDIFSKPKNSLEDYFQMLDNQLELLKHKEVFEDIGHFDINFKSSIIPKMGKQMEEEENWEGLVKLGNYKEILESLSEGYKNAAYKRIEKARKLINHE